MGKGSSSQPAAPDPAATAQAQAQYNKDAAITQANLDRINQVTPQGTLSYSQDTNADGSLKYNSDGTPVYTQTTTLSPAEQQKYDLSNQVGIGMDNLANQGMSQVSSAMSQPFTTSGMTPIQTGGSTDLGLQGINGERGVQHSLDYSGLSALPDPSNFMSDQQSMANTVYQQAASRLNPQWQQSDSDLQASLAAQGISNNSDAYTRAMNNQAMAKNDAYNQAIYSAQQAGAQEQAQQYGQALSTRQQQQNEVDTQGNFYNTAQQQTFNENAARAEMANQNAIAQFNANQQGAQFNNQAQQQQFQEAAYQRELPVNEISALLNGGAVNSPQFSQYAQVGVAAPDYSGIVQNNYNQAVGMYNTQQQAQSQMLGSVFGSLGTVGAAAMKVSDWRFKENIKRIGTLANGLATYVFNYIGDAMVEFGVMAQEALDIVPEAVGTLSDGTLYVDYGKVF